MNGKIVVVTGAAGALGSAVVRLARAQGAVVAEVDHAPRTATSQQLQIGGIDLSDPAQAARAFDTIATEVGAIDALINTAGAFAFDRAGDGDPATWERMHRLNLMTALNAARAAIPRLLKSTAGRIINIGAVGALQAAAGMGPYAASKSGVHRLTEALAAEFKGKITVNAVLPSTIDTAANRKAMPQADFSSWVTVDELAHVILFLASDAASGITGALIPVSGRV